MRGRRGVRILDDSYNANPASLRAALAVLSRSRAPRWLVMGDMAELGSDSAQLHAAAGQLAREAKVDRLWCTGALTRDAVASFGAAARHFEDTQTMIAALEESLSDAATILIKGSRSACMEQVVSALREGETRCC